MSRRTGFTLVEIMVVMSVTALLSALILVYNASTRETLRLFTEKAHVSQLIFRAKSLALSTYTEGGTARCGYGVRFNRSAGTYDLVAYTPTAACTPNPDSVETDASSFEVVQGANYTLPPTLEFEDEAGGGARDVGYILFIPPDPAVVIARTDGSLITNDSGRIALRIKGRTTDAIVTINAAGQVTF